MAFAWDDVVRDGSRLAAQADKARLELLHDIERRAATLRVLGWPESHALRRASDDHAWETSERGGPVLSKKEIAASVARAYREER